MTTKMNGDDYISSFDLRLWSLHQYIAVTYRCYTLFRWTCWNATYQPEGKRGLLLWLVPQQHARRKEIQEFLEHELEPEKREDTALLPGVDVSVQIVRFSGVPWYLTREQVEPLVEEAMEQLKIQIGSGSDGEPNIS